MKIIKFVKKNKDTYNVYLDNGNIIELNEDIIIKNDLLIKKEVDNDRLSTIISKNDIEKIYLSCINYISYKMRCKSEIVKYLKKKNSDLNVIHEIIDRLIKEGYINDLEYTRAYINDQLLLTNNGPYKIKNNLYKLEIDNKIIEDNINNINSNIFEEKINKIIKKQLSIKKGSNSSRKLKIMSYLINLGYDREMIINIINKFSFNTDISYLQKEYDKLYSKYSKKYNEKELKYFIYGKLLAKGYTSSDIEKINQND